MRLDVWIQSDNSFFHEGRIERKYKNRKFPRIMTKTTGKGLPGVQHWLIECMGNIFIGHDGSFRGEAPLRAGQQSSKEAEPGSQTSGGMGWGWREEERKEKELCRSSQNSEGQQRLHHFNKFLDMWTGWPHPS